MMRRCLAVSTNSLPESYLKPSVPGLGVASGSRWSLLRSSLKSRNAATVTLLLPLAMLHTNPLQIGQRHLVISKKCHPARGVVGTYPRVTGEACLPSCGKGRRTVVRGARSSSACV
jgi:hypothetical protein